MRGATWSEDDITGEWEALGPPPPPKVTFEQIGAALAKIRHLCTPNRVVVMTPELRRIYLAGLSERSRWVRSEPGFHPEVLYYGCPIVTHPAAGDTIHLMDRLEWNTRELRDANLAGG